MFGKSGIECRDQPRDVGPERIWNEIAVGQG